MKDIQITLSDGKVTTIGEMEETYNSLPKPTGIDKDRVSLYTILFNTIKEQQQTIEKLEEELFDYKNNSEFNPEVDK